MSQQLTLAVLPGGQSTREELPHEFEAADLWDVRRTARYLAKSASWVYREAETKRLPFRKVSGTLRFIPSELRAWVMQQPGNPLDQAG